MKWIRRAAAAVLPAAALVLLAAGPAFASVPTVSYSLTGTCGNGGCTFHVTIDSNPGNNGVRAWEHCSNGQIYLGSWHFAVGDTSNTASCGTGNPVTTAGFDYRKNSPIRLTCYSFGGARTGFC